MERNADRQSHVNKCERLVPCLQVYEIAVPQHLLYLIKISARMILERLSIKEKTTANNNDFNYCCQWLCIKLSSTTSPSSKCQKLRNAMTDYNFSHTQTLLLQTWQIRHNQLQYYWSFLTIVTTDIKFVLSTFNGKCIIISE